MKVLITVLVIVVVLALLGLAMSARIVKQYEDGVLFRLGRVVGERAPGFRLIIPFVDVLHRISLRIVTMARQAEAEREKRAKIINAEGESLAAAALGDASDIMMAHPLALQLRNLQSLVEIGVDKNTTVVFPAPLMSTIGELGSFLARETAAAGAMPAVTTRPGPVPVAAVNGKATKPEPGVV